MNARPHVPLLAKVLGWLLLHLLILALAFVGFVGWQLGLGLDSLLSGSAGDRLRAFGDEAREKILYHPPTEWNALIEPLAKTKNVRSAMFDQMRPDSIPFRVPKNVLERARTSVPPQPGPPVRRGPPPIGADGPPEGDDLPFPDDFDERPPPPGRRPLGGVVGNRRDDPLPPSRPAFLVRGEGGDGYWAGIQVVLPGPPGQPRHPRVLLVRADSLDGSGMFFDFKPWLWGGLAVLALSLTFWTPFVWGITRYIRRLTGAADRIAAGQFNVSLPSRGNDELGNLGHAIETMASRLDHLISGQKRFLGDAAHELCAPLARLRTGLGILEMKLAESEQPNLLQIESDAGELATLVEEILAFSRAGNRAPRLQMVSLEPLIREISAREGGEKAPEIQISPELTAVADSSLLGRAIGNLIRNSRIHAGPQANIAVHAANGPDFVEITVTDDGPGVPPDELSRLFEPFYRPDRSRSRDTGGTGLGLAIVRTAIEACGGEATAALPSNGGFSVTLHLRKCLPEGF
ncbi:MAG: HAMP domain-containing sensor histidine kinase [Luteolibacter sp.]|uniref:sensor histidine kinase n=1 Tax=Luteolibacter sp. TaxID=1962973 RepID=UPI0032643913